MTCDPPVTRIFSIFFFLFVLLNIDSNVEAAGKTNVMVISDFRRALPQFVVVGVKNLILLGMEWRVRCTVCN